MYFAKLFARSRLFPEQSSPRLGRLYREHVRPHLQEAKPYALAVWKSAERHPLFTLTVALPTLLAFIYYTLIASDIYVSESQFVVRTPDGAAPTGLGTLLQSAGLENGSSADSNGSAVKVYITSRDALRELDKELNLKASWSSWWIDSFHRFSTFGIHSRFEYLYLYYQHRVSVQLDSHSDILLLTVNTFNAEQALQISQALLAGAEKIVNELNSRARNKTVEYAQSEELKARKVLLDAERNLAHYRSEKGVIDPEQESVYQFQIEKDLYDQLLQAKVQSASDRKFAPQSPEIATLDLRADTIEDQIDKLNERITGSTTSLVAKDEQYQQLLLQKLFADKYYEYTLETLKKAESDAEHQQLYLEVISQPTSPDVAMEPKRFQGVLVTFLVGLVSWGILSMILAGIREHQL